MSDLRKLQAREIAYAFNVNRRTISRWVKHDGMPKNEDGTFDLAACIPWAIEKVEAAAAEKSDKPQPGEKWIDEFRRIRFLREELAHKRDLGELTPTADIEREYTTRLQLFVSGLNAFESRLPPLLAKKSRAEISEILGDEVELLLHAYNRRGQYTPAIADEILAELGGWTNRAYRQARVKMEGNMPSFMHFDPPRQVYIDTRSGAEVPPAEVEQYLKVKINNP